MNHNIFSNTTSTYTTTSTSTSKTTTTRTTTTTSTTAKLEWCNLDGHEVIVQKRLRTSKEIIVVDDIEDQTYQKAKSVCENICGNLYFPSTMNETDEVESVLELPRNGYVWLRITYNETTGKWYDPEYKETLTFVNFDSFDKIRDCGNNDKRIHNCGTTKEHHALTDYGGEWWSRSQTSKTTSENVLCELT